MPISNKDYLREYRKNNPEILQKWRRQFKLKKYGITIEEYNKLLEEQDGCCKICGKYFTEYKRDFSVDHNHTTGKVRGLLCNSCNTGIGLLGEDIDILIKAIKYLSL